MTKKDLQGGSQSTPRGNTQPSSKVSDGKLNNQSPGQLLILKRIKEWFGETKFQLTELSNKFELPLSQIAPVLKRLVSKGSVLRVSYGVYQLSLRESTHAIFLNTLKETTVHLNDKSVHFDLDQFTDPDIKTEACRNVDLLMDHIDHLVCGMEDESLWYAVPILDNLPRFNPERISRFGCSLVEVPHAEIIDISEIKAYINPSVWKCRSCNELTVVDDVSKVPYPNKPTYPCPGCKQRAKYVLQKDQSQTLPYRVYTLSVGGEQFEAISVGDTFYDPVHEWDLTAVLETVSKCKGEYKYRFNIQEGRTHIETPYDEKKALEFLGNHDLFEEISLHSEFEMARDVILAGLIGSVEQANLLLKGDPSRGKSHLLEFITCTLFHDVYVDSKTSSTVGLMGGVNKDQKFEKGAILRSKYVCSIDDLDNTSLSDRIADLNNLMERKKFEQHKIISASFPITCSLFFGCNDDSPFPASFMSRIDMKLTVSPSKAIRISEDTLFSDKDRISELSNALIYLRHQSVKFPRKLQVAVMNYRNALHDAIDIDVPRSLTHLRRIARGIAKIKQHDEITIEDLKETCRFYERIHGLPETSLGDGKLPKSAGETRLGKLKIIEGIISELDINKSLACASDIEIQAQTKDIERNETTKILKELKIKGVIYEPRHGFFTLTNE